MSKVKIEQSMVTFFIPEETASSEIPQAYEEIYRVLRGMSHILNVDCPDVGIENRIINIDGYGMANQMCAITYFPERIPALNKPLIRLATQNFDPVQLTGILAHEMRHIWQSKYQPEINKKYADGFGDSLNHPAEIDADGFAIWYLSFFQQIPYDEAGEIVCPFEKLTDPDSYLKRIMVAKKIDAEKVVEANENAPKDNHKNSIFGSFLKKFSGGK